MWQPAGYNSSVNFHPHVYIYTVPAYTEGTDTKEINRHILKYIQMRTTDTICHKGLVVPANQTA